MRISDWSSDVCSSDLRSVALVPDERLSPERLDSSHRRTTMTKHLSSLARKNETHQDNTPHPGRPGPEDLVPSRYALRVGEIDVLVVSDGVLPLPTATLATNANPAVRAAWPAAVFRTPDPAHWPLHARLGR